MTILVPPASLRKPPRRMPSAACPPLYAALCLVGLALTAAAGQAAVARDAKLHLDLAMTMTEIELMGTTLTGMPRKRLTTSIQLHLHAL